MYRFFEDKSSLVNNQIILSKNNSHHIKVLRIKADEEFEVVVDGVVYQVKLLENDKNNSTCVILSHKKDENESNIKINLYQGLAKSDKLEWIIQKCTELGVNSIRPFTSSRTIVKWDQKKENKKLARYHEIAESAAKQSKRSIIPTVNESLTFNEMIKALEAKFVIVAYENRGYSLKEILTKNSLSEVNIVIGPEGGFSEEEIEKFESISAHIVNLGNRILRTETAAMALTAMIQYESGDIN